MWPSVDGDSGGNVDTKFFDDGVDRESVSSISYS